MGWINSESAQGIRLSPSVEDLLCNTPFFCHKRVEWKTLSDRFIPLLLQDTCWLPSMELTSELRSKSACWSIPTPILFPAHSFCSASCRGHGFTSAPFATPK